MGEPQSVVDLGSTEIPHEMLMEYLQDLANTSYRYEHRYRSGYIYGMDSRVKQCAELMRTRPKFVQTALDAG